MKTEVIREAFAIEYATVYDDVLTVSWTELKTAEVGKTWSITDQDKAVNRTEEWEVSYTKVYANDDGCAVLYKSMEPGREETNLAWFDYAR